MRFYSPNARLNTWHLTIVYEDTGQPFFGRVGDHQFRAGGVKKGEVKLFQFECQKEHHSVEIYPPAILLAVICAPEPGLDPQFMESLAERDKAELSDPRRHQLITLPQAHELGILKN
jgi:hypothetical protein